MGGGYKKYTVIMEVMNDEYRLWKNGMDKVVCTVETYKEKRSAFLSVANLLPSTTILTEMGREYKVILMGVDDGQLIHRDFGTFFVNQKGEGNLFKKFTGPSLDCYTHCILVAAHKEKGDVITVLSGEMPFYKKIPEETHSWTLCFDRATKTGPVQFFSKGWDETGASWYRVSWTEPIPEEIKDCSKQIERYGHYILGKRGESMYVGVPGRFLKAEKPMGEDGPFALWQPIKGGEKFFKNLAELSEGLQDEIFGYWIGGIDREDGQILPV